MNGNPNDEYGQDEWEDDSEPVYRSLSLGAASFGGQTYGDNDTFHGDRGISSMAESMQTYDADEEAPVYRSLSVAPAPNPHSSFGGFGDAGHMHHMGAHTMAQQKTSFVTSSTSYPSVTLSAVPISTSFLDACHVYAQGDKDQIASKLSDFLREECVDFTFKDTKAKWKCVHYDCGEHVDFRVRLYSANNQIIVEFNRRQGPLLQFNRLYQTVLFKLSQDGLLRDPVRTPARPLPVPSFPAAAPQVIDDGVKRLVDMAQDQMQDIKHQALVSLTKLSGQPEYQDSLVRQSAAVRTFRSCISGSPHIRRCAVTVLADMSATEKGQDSVAQGLGVAEGDPDALQRLFAMAVGGGPTFDLESRRQSCRLLARLAGPFHSQITEAATSNTAATRLLVDCDQVTDLRLKKYLLEIKEALRAKGVEI